MPTRTSSQGPPDRLRQFDLFLGTHRPQIQQQEISIDTCDHGRLRAALEHMVQEEGAELFIPPPELCTDNAAMAAVAVEKHRLGQWASLDLDAFPSYGQG